MKLDLSLAVRRACAVLLVTLMSLAVSMIGDGAVSAHTGFESSTPSEGAVIEAPVELVTIVFTGEATPVGDEFIALTPDGVLQEPVSIETLDDKLFSIGFDPPLAGGQIGLRWNVQAADSHPIEGAFSFTVSAPVPTTTAPTTAAPTTEPPLTTTPTSTGNESASTLAEPGVTEVSPESDEEVVDEAVAIGADATPPASDETGNVAGELVAQPTQSLDEFLIVDNSTPGETTATVGRVIGFLGVALGLGAFAFVAAVLRGRREEVRHALSAVRVLGVVVAVGAAIEYVGVTRIGSESLASGWSTAPGFATVLRIVGGIGLAVGIAGTISRGRVQRPGAARSLSSAVIDDLSTQPRRTADHPVVRWTLDARSWPAMAGAALIIMSFWFDGHTVSKGFRPLHALVNSVHVAAGSVWVGGVVTMAAIIWFRYRSDQPMRVVELVVRFSKIATIALGAVVLAGGIMAILVLDSFGELTGTTWGKILLLKTAAVGLAIIGGAYNHFRLLPALEADPDSPELLAELRNTVTAEAIMLVFVVLVTAWLVAAAS